MGGDLLVVSFAKSTWTNFRCLTFFLLSSTIFVSTSSMETRHHHQQRQISNFVSVNYLPNGKVETRVHYNGISAKEIAHSNRNPSGPTIRVLTDGKRLVRLVYENGTLSRCNFGRKEKRIRSLTEKFDDRAEDNNIVESDYDSRRNGTVNTSTIVLERIDADKPLPKDVGEWLNYKKLRRLCRMKKKQLKEERQKKREGQKKKKEEEEKKEAQDMAEALRREQTLNREKLRNRTLNFEASLENSPRETSFFDELLVMPGTYWCGDRDTAPYYTALGLFSGPDRCCRKHDMCELSIPAYALKYGLLNTSHFTLSHCFCDESFRACLKMVESRAADLVGYLFFNVVQTKCFIMKRERACIEWKDKRCEKYKKVFKAVLKTNLRY